MQGRFPDYDIRRAFRRLVRLVGQLEPHLHAGLNVSLSEVMALGELSEVEGLSQHELAQLLGLEKSTVSRLAAGLERRGWVSRPRDPANRRYFQLKLTDSGRASAERIGRDCRRHHQRILAGMTGEEQRSLLTGLAALSRVLDADLRPRTPS